jgi:uncharacterized protein GlcG (DUF336 family)
MLDDFNYRNRYSHGRSGAMLTSTEIAEHEARAAVTFRRPTKIFEDSLQLMHLDYLLAFDGVIASQGGIPLID